MRSVISRLRDGVEPRITAVQLDQVAADVVQKLRLEGQLRTGDRDDEDDE